MGENRFLYFKLSVILLLELASKRIILDFKISLQNICDCRALVSIPPLFRPVGRWPREGLLKTAWTQGRWQLLGQTRVPLHHSRSVSSIKWWKLAYLKYLLQASQCTFYNINIWQLLGQTRVPLHHSRSVSSIKWWKLDDLKYLFTSSKSKHFLWYKYSKIIFAY